MGDISFLTGGNGNSSQSFNDAIYQLENTSILFLNAWLSSPQDFQRAGRASLEAMLCLDHIVSEIMRRRDELKGDNNYSGPPLENQLNIMRATSASPVTRIQQDSLAAQGAGNGQLPHPGTPLTMERLLNKIKHRRPGSTNFRVGSAGEHIFIVGADDQRQRPDSIVEFIVGEFCQHCNDISAVI